MTGRRRVGIDVGGTKAQGVSIDAEGVVVAAANRPTPRGDGSLGELVDTLVELATELAHQPERRRARRRNR